MMIMICEFLLKLLAVSCLILGTIHGQKEHLYSWLGPVVVPIDTYAISPPDSARIQLADVEGIQREIRIKEDVKATIDCSLVLESFITDNSVSAANVTVQWFFRKVLSNDLFEGKEALVSETANRFSFDGDSNEILIIERIGLPQVTREGNAGDYRCEICLNSDGTVCQSGNLSVAVIGEHTCITDFGGNDTIVSKCCEDSDMPVISNSSGFVSTPLNGMLIIGESTCSSIQETVIMCPIRFGPDLCEINYSWMRDGQPLEGQNNFTIFATERGIYSCVVTSKCGEDVATSELYGIPRINSLTGSISGVTGNGCDRVGSPTTPSDVCPKPNERLTLSCDSIVSYTITGPHGNVSNQPLVIETASPSCIGTYTCSSTNLCKGVSLSLTVSLGQEVGQWSTAAWNECSEECGEGIKTRSVTCVGSITNNLLSEERCQGEKPPSSKTCMGPCKDESAVWNYGNWSNCSKECGEGIETRSVTCVGSITSNVLSEERCQGEKLPSLKTCMGPCKDESAVWNYGHWSNCSKECGEGIETRSVTCVGSITSNVLSEERCQGEKLPSSKTCMGPCKDESAVWNYGNWSNCSKECGEGIKTRSVTCVGSITNNLLSEERCQGEKPPSSKTCMGPCKDESAVWNYGNWSNCSKECGEGIETRSVTCVGSITSNVLSEERCQGEKLPSLKTCMGPCKDESAVWNYGHWSNCSKECGEGIETRSVTCVGSITSNVLSEERCQGEKLPSSKTCMGPCKDESAVWNYGHWSNCSKECGEGIETRSVTCVGSITSNVLSEERCQGEKLPSLKTCMGPCKDESAVWNYGHWSNCSKECGEGIETRSVTCVGSITSNVLSEERCQGEKLPSSKTCMGPCKDESAVWNYGNWSNCSEECGEVIKTRSVTCVGSITNNLLSEERCQGEKPHSSKTCMGPCKDESAVWNYGNWSNCSKECGEGIETRSVTCVGSITSNVLSEERCQGEKLPSLKTCMGPCKDESAVWNYGNWSNCSEECGEGIKTRSVTCVSSITSNLLSEELCQEEKLPSSKTCMGPCKDESAVWNYGNWSNCSRECGEGIETRSVTCVGSITSNVLSEERCQGEKLPSLKTCMGPCKDESAVWNYGNWSNCSKECGKGIKTRSVTCVGSITSNVLSEERCQGEKLPSLKTCMGPCKDESAVWNYGDWSDCSKNCGIGRQTRSVVCHLPSTQEVVNDDQCTGPRPQVTSYCNISPCCERDLFPSQCNFAADSKMCNYPMYQEICCCTCHKQD